MAGALVDLDPRQAAPPPEPEGSPSDFWGASCLPQPTTTPLGVDGAFLAAYGKTVAQWQVNAEQDGLGTLFPITGEFTGDLPRKTLARQIIDSAPMGSVGHSRLAVRGSGADDDRACVLSGHCFHGCPSRSPWSAREQMNRILLDHPELHVIDDRVRALAEEDGHCVVDVHLAATSVRARRVLVAAGWRTTATLLGGKEPSLRKGAELQQSPVIMAPIFFKCASAEDEFNRHFTFHDLVVPHVRGDRLVGLTQVYLPTHELAGRLLASAPPAVRPLIGRALSGSLGRAAASRSLRHVGVAMTFFPGSIDWTSTAAEESAWRRLVVAELNRALVAAGGRVLRGRRVVLGSGRSHHVGAWQPYATVLPRLLAGHRDYLAGTVGPKRAVAVDTALLPHMSPGPHTSTAAACGRLLIDELVEDWA
jgi:hypothetical protein